MVMVTNAPKIHAMIAAKTPNALLMATAKSVSVKMVTMVMATIVKKIHAIIAVQMPYALETTTVTKSASAKMVTPATVINAPRIHAMTATIMPFVRLPVTVRCASVNQVILETVKTVTAIHALTVIKMPAATTVHVSVNQATPETAKTARKSTHVPNVPSTPPVGLPTRAEFAPVKTVTRVTVKHVPKNQTHVKNAAITPTASLKDTHQQKCASVRPATTVTDGTVKKKTHVINVPTTLIAKMANASARIMVTPTVTTNVTTKTSVPAHTLTTVTNMLPVQTLLAASSASVMPVLLVMESPVRKRPTHVTFATNMPNVLITVTLANVYANRATMEMGKIAAEKTMFTPLKIHTQPVKMLTFIPN